VRGEANYTAFRHRVFAIGAASSGSGGGMRSLMALRHILELGCGALVIPEQISLADAADAFDDMDNLKDERAAVALKNLARRLVDVARVLARED
jgi:NAD(P)H-dependent FMN reductase